MRSLPPGAGLELGIALVGFERVAAVGDEAEHAVERLARCSGRVRCGRDHLGVELGRIEVAGAGRAENVLRQHVERSLARERHVLLAGLGGIDRGAALQHLEAVGRHQHRLRGLVEPVVGAADALDEAAGAFRRADVDDEIDVAPVDAEVEGGGGDDRAQRALGHRRLDLAPLHGVERAVMQGDGQAKIVDAPQVLEQQLRLHARVDEQQAQPMRLDRRIDLADGIARRVPDARHRLVELENVDLRLGAADDVHEVGHVDVRLRRVLRHQIGAQLRRTRHRRRQADGAHAGRQLAQPRQRERQQVAALGRRQRVDLVEHDRVEIGEQLGAVGVAEQQRQLLRRRHQDVGRSRSLPRPPRHRRVAGARLGADRQLHLGDRRHEVARDVDRQRLQRRNVESVQAAAAVGAPALGKADEARQEPGQRLAGAGRGDEQGRAAAAPPPRSAPSDAAAGSSPARRTSQRTARAAACAPTCACRRGGRVAAEARRCGSHRSATQRSVVETAGQLC